MLETSLPTPVGPETSVIIPEAPDGSWGSEALLSSIRPIASLPDISPRSNEGEEFWCRRKLRPDGGGGTFCNLPVLGLGVEFIGDDALLTVPTIGYLNRIEREHNQGGFTFAAAEGFVKARALLRLLSTKTFCLSNDRRISLSFSPDRFADIKGGEAEQFSDAPNISPYEHDLIDHIGLAVAPASEADKIAEFSGYALRMDQTMFGGEDSGDNHDETHSRPEFNFATSLTGAMDRLLDTISDYAILPADTTTGEESQLKDYVWGSLEDFEGECNDYLYRLMKVGDPDSIIPFYDPSTTPTQIREGLEGGYLYRKGDGFDIMPHTEADKINLARLREWEVDAKNQAIKKFGIHLDREAFDGNIRRMQSLNRPDMNEPALSKALASKVG